MLQLVLLTSIGCALTIGTAWADGVSCAGSVPLGMTSGQIKDWQISASSSNEQIDGQPKFGRLLADDGYAWCPATAASSEWLQIDLGTPAKISGISIQGKGDGRQWVSQFTLSYSSDALHWQYVSDVYDSIRTFQGNIDSYTLAHAYVDPVMLTRFVRISPVKWNEHPCMKVELFGCQACNQLLGLPPYGKMRASSVQKSKKREICRPEFAHVHGTKGWCPKTLTASEFLEIDVGPPTLIYGVVTRGRGDMVNSEGHWVKSFRLSYGNYSAVKRDKFTDMVFYKDTSRRQEKVFAGNVDHSTERFHYFSKPIFARYVRIHPLEWNRRIGLRAALIGCPFEGECPRGFMQVTKQTPCLENILYSQRAWLNSVDSAANDVDAERGAGLSHAKRHLPPATKDARRPRGDAAGDDGVERHNVREASRALDGQPVQNGTMSSCLVLDNHSRKFAEPLWVADLGSRRSVSGVLILKWAAVDNNTSSLTYYMRNLDRLSVFVGNTPNAMDVLRRADQRQCATIVNVNDVLLRNRLHFTCKQPMSGRYIVLTASGSNSTLFMTVICEIMAYE